MSDFTKEFIGVCVALANLKHSIEGKNWTLNYKGVEYKGNSFNDTLIDVISKYRMGDSKECRFEMEE